ncbi:hypothetical protein YC2023_022639 [Brassica napus]
MVSLGRRKKVRKEAAATARASAKDAAARAGDPDEEKYRLGYGVAGKGVNLHWYVENKSEYEDRAGGEGEEEEDGGRMTLLVFVVLVSTCCRENPYEVLPLEKEKIISTNQSSKLAKSLYLFLI